jgi:hypothetical protein
MKTILKYSLLALVLSLASASSAHADGGDNKNNKDKGKKSAPEIDPTLAVTGLALLAGSLSVAYARRSKV